MRVKGFLFYVFDVLHQRWIVLCEMDGNPVFRQTPEPPEWAKKKHATIQARSVVFDTGGDGRLLVYIRSYRMALASVVITLDKLPRHYHVVTYKAEEGEMRLRAIRTVEDWLSRKFDELVPDGPARRNVKAVLLDDNEVEVPLGGEEGLGKFFKSYREQQAHLFWGDDAQDK